MQTSWWSYTGVPITNKYTFREATIPLTAVLQYTNSVQQIPLRWPCSNSTKQVGEIVKGWVDRMYCRGLNKSQDWEVELGCFLAWCYCNDIMRWLNQTMSSLQIMNFCCNAALHLWMLTNYCRSGFYFTLAGSKINLKWLKHANQANCMVPTQRITERDHVHAESQVVWEVTDLSESMESTWNAKYSVSGQLTWVSWNTIRFSYCLEAELSLFLMKQIMFNFFRDVYCFL